MFGESVVIRVLDRTVVSLDLNKIGMEPEMLAQFREIIGKPNGIILVTGPTGAGKTTTLYSALNELNVISDKIITTEDPVEYDIDGIIQVPINSEIGVTFASALRAILRQDPDKILVGEIRDLETAQIAVQASLTGHIVFSTLHTNDAPSSISRLRDMGLEPFLITATLEAVSGAAAGAQDLRRLPHRVRAVGRDADGVEPAAGGRQGQEVLLRPRLRPLQQQRPQGPAGHLRTAHHERRPARHDLVRRLDRRTARRRAGEHGHADAARVGLARLYSGVTTIEEVVRETVLEDES